MTSGADASSLDWQTKKEFSDIYAEVAREFATEFTKILFEDFQKVTDNIKWNFKEHDLLLTRQEDIIQRLLALTQVSANRHVREHRRNAPTIGKGHMDTGSQYRTDPDKEKTREISDLAARGCGLFPTCNPAQDQLYSSPNSMEIEPQFISLTSEGVEVLACGDSHNGVYMVPPPAARSETLMAHCGDTVDDIDGFETRAVIPRNSGDMIAIGVGNNTDMPLHVGDMVDLVDEYGWDTVLDVDDHEHQPEVHMYSASRNQAPNSAHEDIQRDAKKDEVLLDSSNPCATLAELKKEKMYFWTAAPEYKQGTGALQRVVKSLPFKVLVSCTIIANSVLIGIHTENAVQVSMGRLSADAALGWNWAEHVFTILFIAELGLRMCADRSEFLSGVDGAVNVLDMVLVSGAFLNIVLEDGFPNISWARLLRILHFLRLLRIIRVLRFFSSLRLMISCIVQSFIPLLWIFPVLIFVLYFFAVVLLHGVSEHIQDSHLSERSESFLRENCGSVAQALLLLFVTASGGRHWIDFYDSLISLNWMYGMFFLVYMYFMMVGVLNIINGLFVDAAVRASQRDREVTMRVDGQEVCSKA